MVNALRDDVAAALYLQQDGGGVGEAVPVRQTWKPPRPHLAIQFRLGGAFSDRVVTSSPQIWGAGWLYEV